MDKLPTPDMAGKWGYNSDLICVFCRRYLESKQAVEWLEFYVEIFIPWKS